MTMTIKEITSELKNYLLKNNEGLSIGDDTDLIDSGLVDSLGLMDLVFYIEKIAGCRIGMEDIEVKNFKTIKIIQDNILNKISV